MRRFAGVVFCGWLSLCGCSGPDGERSDEGADGGSGGPPSTGEARRDRVERLHGFWEEIPGDGRPARLFRLGFAPDGAGRTWWDADAWLFHYARTLMPGECRAHFRDRHQLAVPPSSGLASGRGIVETEAGAELTWSNDELDRVLTFEYVVSAPYLGRGEPPPDFALHVEARAAVELEPRTGALLVRVVNRFADPNGELLAEEAHDYRMSPMPTCTFDSGD